MTPVGRPWALGDAGNAPLGPGECRLSEGAEPTSSHDAAPLLARVGRTLRLHPYPRAGRDDLPPAVHGLPLRPQTGTEPRDGAEDQAAAALARMHEVLARIEELEAALDDPEHVWTRLAEAWRKAEDEADPRMAEIVRQARAMPRRLVALETRIRRVLRRTRELVPIDRVQEMDRSSMLWLVRRPGRTAAERAGASQRVLAVARHENFDTLENRVLRAYVRLARFVTRRWLREHARASRHARAVAVDSFARTCRRLDRELEGLGVGIAEPGATPNYVLMEDRDYRAVRESWLRLLRQETLEDDLWAWQAQSWTDFCVLAVTLTLHGMEGAQLVAQSPVVWLEEARAGRRFLHDRPLAVFHLRRENLVVEVQARPDAISEMQYLTRAWVWLRVTDLSTEDVPRRVPVWTPHVFAPPSVEDVAKEAARFLALAARHRRSESMREGVVLLPAHGRSAAAEAREAGARVAAISLDASGEPLGDGMRALAEFIRANVGAAA